MKKTLEYKEKGSIEEVRQKPIFINPLSVAKKYVYEEKVYKKRLVLDLSRSLNKYQTPRTYKPDNLDRLECLFSQNDYAVTLDLASAYHHVKLSENCKDFFGFTIFDKQQGKERYFRFQRLPFGLSTAGFILSKVTNPILRFCRKNSIRVGIYVDDIIILGQSFEECKIHSEFVRTIFSLAGFTFSIEKATLSQRFQHRFHRVHLQHPSAQWARVWTKPQNQLD